MPRSKTPAVKTSDGRRKGKELAVVEEEPPDLASQFGASFPIYSAQEGKLFRIYNSKEIVVPRYFDFHSLEQLGIKDKIMTMSKKMGWDAFISCQYATYDDLTVEFYSTLQLDPNDSTVIRFRLRGSHCYLNDDVLSAIFRVPKGKEMTKHPSFNSAVFWKQLTGFEEFNVHNAPNGLIRDHCLLLLHKFFSHTVFGKSESNKCSRQDLFLLWCVKNRKPVSLPYYIRHSLEDHFSRKITALTFGFLATAAAEHFEIDVSGLSKCTNDFLDIAHLRRAEIVTFPDVRLRDPRTRRCFKTRNPNPTPPASEDEDGDETATEDSQAGWQTVLTKLEENSAQLASMSHQIHELSKNQRSHQKRLLKFFAISGVAVPSPTPSPPDSPQ